MQVGNNMIITRLYGGMGNQMFQYALGRALSLKKNAVLKLDVAFLSNQTSLPFVRERFVQRPYALDVFCIKAEIAKKEDIPWYGRPFFKGVVMQIIDAALRKIPVLPGWEKKYFAFDQSIMNATGDVYLNGYWQNPNYFQDSIDILREDFSLKNPLPEHIETLKQEILSKQSLCVHVRRGDYAGNRAHDIISDDYYQMALEKFKYIQIDHLYVFSDDIAWCRENMAFDLPMTFVGEEYAGDRATGHFELMRSCTHFIIPNSTFSWWAAYLANGDEKITISPDNWIESYE